MKPEEPFWRPQVNPSLSHPAQLVAFYNGKLLRTVVSEAIKNGLIAQLKELLNYKSDLDESTKKVIQNYLTEMER